MEKRVPAVKENAHRFQAKLAVEPRSGGTLRADSKITWAFWRAVATASGVRLHRRISNMPASPSFAALSSPRQNTQFIYEPTLNRNLWGVGRAFILRLAGSLRLLDC